MRRGIKRTIRWSLSTVIIVLLVLFARTVDWHQAWNVIRHASFFPLMAALILNVLSLMVKGARWWIFLRPVGVRSLWLALRATVAGAGLNNILVANAGEAARVVFVSRASDVTSASVLAALTLERFFDIIAYIMMLAAAAAFLQLPGVLDEWRYPALGALLVAVIVVAFLLRDRRREPRARTRTDPAIHASGLVERTRSYGFRFLNGVRAMTTGPRFALALLLSAISWGLQIATYHLCAVSVQFPITIAGSVAAVLLANIGFLVRVTPGGVGVFQLIYAFNAELFGLDRDAAVAVALLLQTLQVVPVTLLGVALAPEFVFKRRERAQLAEPPVR